MIYANSRYQSSQLLFTSDGSGSIRRVVEFPRPRPLAFSAQRHVVREYERLDLLAARYFGDPDLWWVIAEANPEVFYPEDIEPGTSLRIPSAPALR